MSDISRAFLKTSLIAMLLLFQQMAFAKSPPAVNTLNRTFSDWTTSFNRKDLEATCSLFAPNVILEYQGQPPKTYSEVCTRFRKLFADNDLKYHYEYKIHDIYLTDDWAAVRITWILKADRKNKNVILIQEEGMDIMTKNAAGKWSIIRSFAYPSQALA